MRIGLLLAAAAAGLSGGAGPAFGAAGGWGGDLGSALRTAGRLDRPVLIHFSAAWCGPCRRMKPVLHSPIVARRLDEDAVGVSLDFDAHRDVAAKYGVASIPADVLLAPDGRVLGVMSGFKTAPDYARRVAAVASQYRDLRTRLARRTPADPVRAPAPRGSGTGVPDIALLDPDVARDASWGDGPALPAPARKPERPDPELPPNDGAFGDSAPRYDDFRDPAADPGGPAPEPRRTNRPVAPADRPPLPDPFGPDPLADDAGRTPSDADSPAPGRPRVARRVDGGAPRLLGMRGYCPVTLHETRRWVRGDSEYAWEHQGVTYFMADAQTFAAFVKASEAFAPRLLGCDPVLYRDEGRAVPGKTKHAAIWRGGLFLFATADTRRTFAADPTAYAASRQVLLIEEIEGVGTF